MIDKLKRVINNSDFVINPDYNSDSVFVEKKYGYYTFNFLVTYERNYSDYMSSSEFNPDEYSCDFKITKVEELEIYDQKGDLSELTEKEYEELTELLEDKLINKQIAD